MEANPTCTCKGTEFICKPVQMPDNNVWNPVICKACGAIAGQLPSKNEQEALKQAAEISTILERLDNIQTLLFNMEANMDENAV
ncbi:MAG: hypothetical protein FWC06_01395 [Treponema sp.]|nr:hypothetical protein [Treponema sp.]